VDILTENNIVYEKRTYIWKKILPLYTILNNQYTHKITLIATFKTIIDIYTNKTTR